MEIREKQILFGSLLLISNKIQTIYDSVLGDISLMQFMLLNMLQNAEKEYLNLNELAKLLGSTRQNVRQIVNSLLKKQYVTCNRSQSDKRELRVCLTKKAMEYFIKNEQLGNLLLEKLFTRIEEAVLLDTLKCCDQLFANLAVIAKEYLHAERT